MTQDIVSFRPQNTARRRGGPSSCVQNFLSTAKPPITATILDFGCGFGEDADYLTSLGYSCDKYDPHYYPDYPNKKYDYVLCFYVLNVLPEFAERLSVIGNVLDRTKQSAYFTVRNKIKRDENYSIHYKDGYYNPVAKTFNKKFDRHELNFLFNFFGNYPASYFGNFYRIIIDLYGY